VLTDAERIDIALLRFEPLRRGHKETPINELMAKFARPKNTITRAIRESFRRRLVEVRRKDVHEAKFRHPERLRHLEVDLVAAFPRLSTVVVVNCPEKESDLVHKELGYGMASELRALVRDGFTIGVGSGRGAYYTIAALNQFPDLQHQRITLMSLSGALYPKTHFLTVNTFLDADYHTCQLGRCFSQPLTQRMVSYPIAQEHIGSVRGETWLDDAHYARHTPELALVGLGVLRPRHRFHEAVTSGSAQRDLRPICIALEELVWLTDKYSDESYCPVADVCNRLFFVEAAESRIDPSARKRFSDLIDTVNRKLLNIDRAQLGRVGGLCLVAGTPSKTTAILSLLQASEKRELHIKALVIDGDTADLVLQRAKRVFAAAGH
jgi:DNA-binding transcriptional regulator LsrR (DeoR family)